MFHSGFHFVIKIILRNRTYVHVNMALNSRGRSMSEIIKTAIVKYLLMHLSEEAILSKLKHFQIYEQQTRPVLLNQKLAIWQRTQKNKKEQHTLLWSFLKTPQKTVRLPGLWAGLSKGYYYLLGMHATERTSSCV